MSVRWMVAIVCVLGVLSGSALGDIGDAVAYDNYTTGYYTLAQMDDFGPAVTFDVDPGESYVDAGVASRVTSVITRSVGGDPIYRDQSLVLDPIYHVRTEVYLGTEAAIKAGSNTGEVMTTVSMQWRTRVEIEVDARGYPRVGLQMPPMAYDSYGQASDVVQISGMVGAYVLESKYDDGELIYEQPGFDEELYASMDKIYLGWLEDEEHITGGALADQIEWVHATEGNDGSGTVVANYQGSFEDFIADPEYSDFTVAGYLGSYGVDIEDNTVWAIINHNSRFAAVPEPTPIGLLLLGALALLHRGRK